VIRLFIALFLPVAAGADDQLNGVLISARQGVTLRVNGFPLHVGSAAEPSTLTYELNAYLKQGPNVFELTFPRPNLAGGENTLIRFRLEHLATPAATEVALFQIERTLARATSEDTSVVRPLVETALLNGGSVPRRQIDTTLPEAGFALGIWRINEAFASHQVAEAILQDKWSLTAAVPQARLLTLPWDGEPPVLTDADRGAIRALVGQIHEAISTLNRPAITNLFASKTARFAVARAQTEETVRAALLSGFTNLHGTTPPFVFAAPDLNALEFTTVPGTALIHVHSGGEPPIKAVSGTSRFGKAIFVARIQGEWRLVD
jgi:hypothetical protein